VNEHISPAEQARRYALRQRSSSPEAALARVRAIHVKVEAKALESRRESLAMQVRQGKIRAGAAELRELRLEKAMGPHPVGPLARKAVRR
jgi:hypothetical protein